MLYLKNTRSNQRVHIPRRSGDDGEGIYSLTLREVAGDEAHIARIEDNLTRSSMYYSGDILLPEGIMRGEYEYILRKGDKVVASGIAQIGGYDIDVADVEYTPQYVAPMFDIEVVEHSQSVDFESYDPDSVGEELYLGVLPSTVWLTEANEFTGVFEVVSNVRWQVNKV